MELDDKLLEYTLKDEEDAEVKNEYDSDAA